MVGQKTYLSAVAEWLERLIFNLKVLGLNLSLPGERSNHETSRTIVFYSVYLVSFLVYHNFSLYVLILYTLTSALHISIHIG